MTQKAHRYSQQASKTMAHAVARHLAERSRPRTVSELAVEMGLVNADGKLTADRSTVFRWLQHAQEMGLVEMMGEKRGASWTASDEVRRDVLKEQLSAPVDRRPVVTYEEEFLQEYIPNKTFYLSSKDRARLNQQCAIGSAAFSTLPTHDQSMFLCGLSYASSSMEGNHYDLIATEKLLLESVEMEDATPEETTMVQNHHEAIRFLVDNIRYPTLKNDVNVTSRDIKSLHALLSAYLLRDPMMCGSIRHSPVRIKHSSYIPLSVQESIDRALTLICTKAQAIADPYEQSFFLLTHLPYLQPFEDCNKRTSRLACNIPLLRRGVVPMSWMDVDQTAYNSALLGVYERTNTSLLAEVFVHGYINSTSRFEIMQKSIKPDETQVRYRKEIRNTVRSIVLDGDPSIGSEVLPQDHAAFQIYVEKELDLLRKGNPGTIVLHRLQDADVNAWMANAEKSSGAIARERQIG
jgi:Fic/DOC family